MIVSEIENLSARLVRVSHNADVWATRARSAADASLRAKKEADEILQQIRAVALKAELPPTDDVSTLVDRVQSLQNEIFRLLMHGADPSGFLRDYLLNASNYVNAALRELRKAGVK